MLLTILDLILLLIIFVLIAYGFWSGFIQALGALLGVVLATWLTGKYYIFFGDWLGQYVLSDADNLRNIVSFIILFTLINRLIGFLFVIIDKIFGLISFIPFTKMINRLFGATLGALEGVFALGLILYFVSKFEVSEWFTGVLDASQVAHGLIVVGNVLAPLLPELIQQLKSIV